MSADRYEPCPRCKAESWNELERERVNLDEAYGKVTAEQYMRRRDIYYERLNARKDFPQDLRMDFDWWLDEDGQIRGHFKARCSECGWSEEIDLVKPAFPASKAFKVTSSNLPDV